MAADWKRIYAGRYKTADQRFEAIRSEGFGSVSRRPWRVADHDTGKYIVTRAESLQDCKKTVERFLKREAEAVTPPA